MGEKARTGAPAFDRAAWQRGLREAIAARAGSLLIGTINNGLIIMGLDVSEQMMVAGGIIILAVAFGKKPAN
jgi:ribose transport system permease protein